MTMPTTAPDAADLPAAAQAGDARLRRVAVLGLGYIGLPTAATLATRGVDVLGVDVDPGVVAAVNRGEALVVEPDLAVTVSGSVSVGRLRAATEPGEADAYVIAVPTPVRAGGDPDLSHVMAATDSLAAVLQPGAVVILESTVPPGTTRRVSERLAARRPDLVFPHEDSRLPDVHIAHCPERVLPGRIMIEIVTNDRVVGGLTPACAERAAELYRLFCHGAILLTDAGSAEMSKLAENAYRDVNIAFANELAVVCEKLRLDVWEVIAMANRHPRVAILNPGPGVGGHCIPVDPWFIAAAAPDETRLIRTARAVNDERPHRVVDQVVGRAERMLSPTVACLGLAFKADVDDLRGSPALEIVTALAARLPQDRILVVEPHVDVLPAQLAGLANVEAAGLTDALDRADVVVALVDHSAFRGVKRSALEGKVVFDTRGIWH